MGGGSADCALHHREDGCISDSQAFMRIRIAVPERAVLLEKWYLTEEEDAVHSSAPELRLPWRPVLLKLLSPSRTWLYQHPSSRSSSHLFTNEELTKAAQMTASCGRTGGGKEFLPLRRNISDFEALPRIPTQVNLMSEVCGA